MSDEYAETTAAAVFQFSRLYGNEKYSLQNMLIRQVGYPMRAKPSDLSEAWSDRFSPEMFDAASKVSAGSKTKRGGGDACDWHRHCPADEFLAYAQALVDAGAFGKQDRPVTGARLVRYTNAASGYRWDIYFGPPGNGAAPITYPDDERFSIYGISSHERRMMMREFGGTW